MALAASAALAPGSNAQAGPARNSFRRTPSRRRVRLRARHRRRYGGDRRARAHDVEGADFTGQVHVYIRPGEAGPDRRRFRLPSRCVERSLAATWISRATRSSSARVVPHTIGPSVLCMCTCDRDPSGRCRQSCSHLNLRIAGCSARTSRSMVTPRSSATSGPNRRASRCTTPVEVFERTGAAWDRKTTVNEPEPEITYDFGAVTSPTDARWSVAATRISKAPRLEAPGATPGLAATGSSRAACCRTTCGRGTSSASPSSSIAAQRPWVRCSTTRTPASTQAPRMSSAIGRRLGAAGQAPAPRERGGDLAGFGLALQGDTLLMGAFSHTTNQGGYKSGSAYVFTRTGGTWRQFTSLVPDDLSPNDGFGTAVAVDGNRALVATAAQDEKTGAVYAYDLNLPAAPGGSYRGAVLDNSPASYWRFEDIAEAGAAIDETASGRTGTGSARARPPAACWPPAPHTRPGSPPAARRALRGSASVTRSTSPARRRSRSRPG